MSNKRKKKCICVRQVGGTIVDPTAEGSLFWMWRHIKSWSQKAKEGDTFVLEAKRFTQEELDALEEYDEG